MLFIIRANFAWQLNQDKNMGIAGGIGDVGVFQAKNINLQ